MQIIRVLFVQTWRPAPDDPPDGTVLEEYRCDTAEEAERRMERLREKYWDALEKTSIQVHDVERCITAIPPKRPTGAVYAEESCPAARRAGHRTEHSLH